MVCIKKERSMGQELWNFLMDHYIQENFIKIMFKEKEYINGMMENHMKEILLIIRCMEKEFTNGLMVNL